jgi:predicted permease
VALSTVLLLASGLLLQTFWSLRHTNIGFAAGNVLTFNVALSDVRYPALADEVRFYDALLGQVRAMPGVASAGMTTLLPLTPGEFGDGFYRVGEDDRYPNIPIARLQNVTPGYLDAIGLPLKAGRMLLPSDRAGAPPVVVVNETLQRRFFPGGAVGRQIRFRNNVTDIVGVVGDKQHRSLREVPRADMYFPRAQVAHPRYLGWVAIRVDGDPMAALTPVRRIIERLDPEVAIDDVETMASRVETAVAADRFRATLIGVLGLVALVLAALGLYGVVAHAVGRDARDIAVRLALGAGAGRTVARVLRSVLLLTAAGITAGFAVAWSAQALVAGFLSGVTPFDPATVAAVVATLVAVAAAAALGPAARAARLDPATILKSQ